jgi:UDP-3-O-[3-hydroxymyristoyl] glucosamine N-acyltransferase
VPMSLADSLPSGEKKYELVPDERIVLADTTLYRIRALKDFGHVKAGCLGGFIESERNLGHHGICWIADEAQVRDAAVVSDDAQVFGCARIYDRARISDGAKVLGNAQVFEDGWIFKNGLVFDNAMIFGEGQVRDSGMAYGDSQVFESGRIVEFGQVCGCARICGRTVVDGHQRIGAGIEHLPKEIAPHHASGPRPPGRKRRFTTSPR